MLVRVPIGMALLFPLLALPSAALALDQLFACRSLTNEASLKPYEPLTGGVTHDSDDTRYLDVNLSVQFRLAPICDSTSGEHIHLYLTMATRFGFYWDTRAGSPVIGKRYNPQLLLRFTPALSDGTSTTSKSYIDLGYAHESNGQLVHTQQQYQSQLLLTPDVQEANQYIHRGWDYVHLAWTLNEFDHMATYLEGKYFLPHGLLQNPEDQYHGWEQDPQGKERKTVDGLGAAVEYPVNAAKIFGLFDLTAKYQTGYDVPLRYSTERLELGLQTRLLPPLAVWVQHGYTSDLAMYYLKVTSYGIEVRFFSFSTQP
jgi:hypothetical protein